MPCEIVYNVRQESKNGAIKSTYIASTIVADDIIDETDKQVLDIFAPSVSQISAVRIQKDEVLVWRVEKWLG